MEQTDNSFTRLYAGSLSASRIYHSPVGIVGRLSILLEYSQYEGSRNDFHVGAGLFLRIIAEFLPQPTASWLYFFFKKMLLILFLKGLSDPPFHECFILSLCKFYLAVVRCSRWPEMGSRTRPCESSMFVNGWKRSNVPGTFFKDNAHVMHKRQNF